MKLLWVKSDLLHPTTKGGHIRTLEILKRLHARHEIHYAAFENERSLSNETLETYTVNTVSGGLIWEF